MKTTAQYIVYLTILLTGLYTAKVNAQKNYYIATWGKSTNSGTLANPWDMATGLKKSLQGGDTLFIQGGTYFGAYQSYLESSNKRYIVVMPYLDQKVVFDGAGMYNDDPTLLITGGWVIFRDLHFISSSTNRVSTQMDNLDIETNSGIFISSSNAKVINCYVYNNSGVGIGFWQASSNSEVYGCIVFNNGYQGVTTGVGHAMYCQNRPDSGIKNIRDNILFNSFGYGLHVYGGWGSYNINAIGNICFNNGILSKGKELKSNILMGGMEGFQNMNASNNYLFNNFGGGGWNLQMGYKNTNFNCIVDDNYMAGDNCLQIRKWEGVITRNNSIASRAGNIISIYVPSGFNYSNYTINNNQYFGTERQSFFSSSFQDGTPVHGDQLSFSQWQTLTGVDKTSKFTSGMPQQNWIAVRPNEYERGRGHIVVYNFQRQNSVNVDVSNILTIGSTFVVYDVQNPFGEPVLEGTYNGGNITLPMNLTQVLAPPGITPNKLEHTTNEFNVFLIRSIKRTNKLQITNLTPRETRSTSVLEYYSPMAQSITLNIYKTDGTRVTQPVTISAREGINSHTVNITALPSDVYRITINDKTDNASIEITRLEDPLPDPPIVITTCPANPSGNEISIIFEAPRDQTVTIELFDENGSKISSENKQAVKGSNPFTKEISGFADATYYIVVSNETSNDYCSFQKKTEQPIVFEINSCSPPVVEELITIDFSCPQTATVVCTIVNSSSAVVKTENLNALLGANKTIINVQDLPPDNYTINLTLGEETKSCSFEKKATPLELIEIISCLYQLETKNTIITFKSPKAQNIWLGIYNSNGERMIIPEKHPASRGINTHSFAFADFPQGSYHITIFDSQNYAYCITEKPEEPVTTPKINITTTFPTPVINELNCQYTSPSAASLTATIHDKTGEIYKSSNIQATAGNNTFKTDVTQLNDGFYFIRIGNNTMYDFSAFQISRNTANQLQIIECVPNRTFDLLFLTYYSSTTSTISLVVKNTSDATVQSLTMNATTGVNNQTINIAALEDGEYQLSISNGLQTSNQAFTKIPMPGKDLEMLKCPDKPIVDNLSLSYSSPVAQKITINYYTPEGKLALPPESRNATIGANTLSTTSIKDLAQGMYYITLSNTTKIIFCKFQKENKEPDVTISIINCSLNIETNEATIHYNLYKTSNITLRVYNASSELIKTESKNNQPAGNNSFTTSISDLPDGIYYFNIADAKSNQYCELFIKREADPVLELIECSPKEATDNILIEYFTPNAGNIGVTVKNSTGATQLSTSFNSIKGLNQRNIDISSLIAGIYTIQINDNTTTDQCSFTKRVEEPAGTLEIYTCNTDESFTVLTATIYSPEAMSVDLRIFNPSGILVLIPSKLTLRKGVNIVNTSIAKLESGRFYYVISSDKTISYCQFSKNTTDPDIVLKVIRCNPSPTLDQSLIDYYINEDGLVELVVLNTLEQVVVSKTLEATGGLNQATVNLKGMPLGIYYIVLQYKNTSSFCDVELVDSLDPDQQLVITQCHPKDVKDLLILGIKTPVTDNATISVISTHDNRVVFSQDYNLNQGHNNIAIDLSLLEEDDYKLIINNNTSIDYCFFTKIKSSFRNRLTLINYHPNPVRHQLTIEYFSYLNGEITIQLFNMTGARVINQKTQQQKGYNSQKIDLSTVPPGIYLVRVSQNEQTISFKIHIL